MQAPASNPTICQHGRKNKENKANNHAPKTLCHCEIRMGRNSKADSADARISTHTHTHTQHARGGGSDALLGREKVAKGVGLSKGFRNQVQRQRCVISRKCVAGQPREQGSRLRRASRVSQTRQTQRRHPIVQMGRDEVNTTIPPQTTHHHHNSALSPSRTLDSARSNAAITPRCESGKCRTAVPCVTNTHAKPVRLHIITIQLYQHRQQQQQQQRQQQHNTNTTTTATSSTNASPRR